MFVSSYSSLYNASLQWKAPLDGNWQHQHQIPCVEGKPQWCDVYYHAPMMLLHPWYDDQSEEAKATPIMIELAHPGIYNWQLNIKFCDTLCGRSL